jgi:hypothetical protein
MLKTWSNLISLQFWYISNPCRRGRINHEVVDAGDILMHWLTTARVGDHESYSCRRHI